MLKIGVLTLLSSESEALLSLICLSRILRKKMFYEWYKMKSNRRVIFNNKFHNHDKIIIKPTCSSLGHFQPLQAPFPASSSPPKQSRHSFSPGIQGQQHILSHIYGHIKTDRDAKFNHRQLSGKFWYVDVTLFFRVHVQLVQTIID